MTGHIVNDFSLIVHIDDDEEFNRQHFQHIEEAILQQKQEIINAEIRMMEEKEDEDEDDLMFELMSQDDLNAIDNIIATIPKIVACFEEKEDDFDSLFEPMSQDDIKVIDSMVETVQKQEKKLRILSIDIECTSRGRDIFPEPHIDAIIQIGNTCFTLCGETEKMEQTIFTLDTCSPIQGVDVIECKDEVQLLEKWHAFLHNYDPDIMTGYYFTDFDLRYMVQRAECLRILKFPFLGRDQGKKVKVTSRSNFSKKYETVSRIPGRELVDMWFYIAEHYSLKSKSLNSASKYFLGESKDNVPYDIIPSLQAESADTRRRLAKYCLQDTLLTWKLFKKMVYQKYKAEYLRAL